MAPARSRSGRALVPSTKKSKFDSMSPLRERSKGKQIKKASGKRKYSRRVVTPSPAPESDAESIIEVLRQTAKPSKMPIDVTKCKYTLGCVTMFNDRKFNQDSGSFHLGEFKVHEYNAKAIKAVQKHAETVKLGYELDSALAVVSALRLKQLTKTIEDPSDWKALESLIEDYMKEGFRFLRVDYTVTYSKAPRRIQINETEDSIGHEDDDLEVVQVAPRRRIVHSI